MFFKKESVFMKKEIFSDVKLFFVLSFDDVNNELIEEARREINPTREVKTRDNLILFLETDKKTMVNPGIDIPKKFAKFVRLMAIMPTAEKGHIDGQNIVSFGSFIDSCTGECLFYQKDLLIGEYYLFDLVLDLDLDQSFDCLFVSIIGQKLVNSNIGVSIGQNIYKLIVEVVDIDEPDLPNNYSIRCPRARNICLAKTKIFDSKIREILKN